MNAVELLREVAPFPREPQNRIAEDIEKFLAGGKPVMCVNAETGIGKTLAYGAPVALAASAGRRVVVSTHTTQQLEQAAEALRSLAGTLPRPVAVARRLGRANFLSPGRVARLLANRDDLDGEARALLREAMGHGGLIDDFEAGHGALPVARADICLTSSCRRQDAYDAQRVETGAAGIVVQTHAMSVLDAVRGEVAADIAVYDEGDALPSAAAGFAEARVTPLDLEAVRERHATAGLDATVAAFEAWAGQAVGDGEAVFKQRDPEAARRAEAIRAALETADSEHAGDVRRALSAFVNLDPATPRRGAAVVAAHGGHRFEVLALDPGRVLRRTYDGRKTLFVSATLAAGRDGGRDAFEPFLRTVGADGLAAVPRRVEPERFGAMAFRLADRNVPPPFRGGGERNPAFDDYAAGMVRAAMDEGGRVLALAPSFADVDEVARRVGGIVAHRRGESLAGRLDEFRSSPDAVLATPAAWAGTDLPGLLAHIVILRVPFPPPSPGRTRLLGRFLETRGRDGEEAKGILLGLNRREAVRRLAQGLGRGVRGPDDRVTVWIADPRFPLPDTLALDPRRLTGQGEAVRHRDLAGAVPRRFGDAYAAAEIHGNGAGASSAR